MNASAKGMLRETRTTRHRCGFATSVDCVSKRPKRAQQPRLQEHMLQLNKQGEWRDGVVRVVPTVHLPESMINISASPKTLLKVKDVAESEELRPNPTRILKQRNLIKDAKKNHVRKY